MRSKRVLSIISKLDGAVVSDADMLQTYTLAVLSKMRVHSHGLWLHI